MPLLVCVASTPDGFPGAVTLEVGDLVLFTAPGGVIESGSALEALGAVTQAVPGPEGHPLAPQGPPNLVLFRAARPGEALVRITTGDVWHQAGASHIRVVVR
jgi:hypothetical protein